MHDLIKLQQEAIELASEGNYKAAIKLYEIILEKDPGWELGSRYC